MSKQAEKSPQAHWAGKKRPKATRAKMAAGNRKGSANRPQVSFRADVATIKAFDATAKKRGMTKTEAHEAAMLEWVAMEKR